MKQFLYNYSWALLLAVAVAAIITFGVLDQAFNLTGWG